MPKLTEAFTDLIDCLKMGAYRSLIVDNAPLTSVMENITSEQSYSDFDTYEAIS